MEGHSVLEPCAGDGVQSGCGCDPEGWPGSLQE